MGRHLIRRGRLLGALAVLGLGCASEGPPRTFDNNDLELGVGNAARMSCSCLFVMKMSDEYCRAWVKASPDVAHYSVDTSSKVVDARAFVGWTARARFVDEQRGCVLE